MRPRQSDLMIADGMGVPEAVVILVSDVVVVISRTFTPLTDQREESSRGAWFTAYVFQGQPRLDIQIVDGPHLWGFNDEACSKDSAE